VIYYSCCCCSCCNAACTQATGSVQYTECTEYFYPSTLCSGGICYGPVSVRLFVTSCSPAHNSHLQSHTCIYAHSRWRCLNVLPCALQKWLNRSMQSPKPTPIHAKCCVVVVVCFAVFFGHCAGKVLLERLLLHLVILVISAWYL